MKSFLTFLVAMSPLLVLMFFHDPADTDDD